MTGQAGAAVTASSLVAERFGLPQLAVLSGSVARGEATSTSDLDVVVVLPGPPAPYRETVRHEGWLVELFVHTPDSVDSFCEQERAQGRCTLAHMLATGVVLIDSPDGARLRDDARALVDAGPPLLGHAELDRRRYLLTDAVDDLVGATDPDERDAVAGHLVSAAADLALRGHGQWAGTGKWLHRQLRAKRPVLARELMAAHRSVVVAGDPAALVSVVDELLDQFGGALREGYRVPAADPRMRSSSVSGSPSKS